MNRPGHLTNDPVRTLVAVDHRPAAVRAQLPDRHRYRPGPRAVAVQARPRAPEVRVRAADARYHLVDPPGL
jgi:hypothetical protein